MIYLEGNDFFPRRYSFKIDKSIFRKGITNVILFILQKRASALFTKMKNRAAKDLIVSVGLLSYLKENGIKSEIDKVSTGLSSALEFFYEIKEGIDTLIVKAEDAEIDATTLIQTSEILSKIISNYHQSLRIASSGNKCRVENVDNSLLNALSNRSRSVIKELYGN